MPDRTYLNIAGGLKISDPAADLAVVAALASSLRNRPVENGSIYLGEVGLGGEIRKVNFLLQRLKEAEKMGIKTVFSPKTKTAEHLKIDVKTAAQISELM